MHQKGLALFLPGFLGGAEDWKPVWERLNEQGLAECWDFQSLSPFAPDSSYPPTLGFEHWAQQVNNDFSLKCRGARSAVVIGYSLGGRLALHLLAAADSCWKGGVIVSAHPGLQTQEEKNQRRLVDEDWAQKFLEKDWQELMQEWGAQGVLGNDRSLPPRQERAFDRQLLAKGLKTWSLAEQQDFRSWITKGSKPLLWLTGERDSKFTNLALALQGPGETFQHRVVKGCGHRLPWEQLDVFTDHLSDFLRQSVCD